MKLLSYFAVASLIASFGCANLRFSGEGRDKPVLDSMKVASYDEDDDEKSVDGEEDDSDPDADPDSAEADKPEETPPGLEEIQVSEARTKEEIEADALARKTFPLVYNEMVAQWIKYFDGKRGFPVMKRWLGRSTRYIPMMKQVLRDEGLPEDLIYLAMIESGFNPKAASRAKAVGPWQFIKSTGERYGLKVNHWVDERRDYRKSTYAAAKYLQELHIIFGSWYLAAASYNAGEGKTLAAIRRDRTRNFWELARKKTNFRAETRNYVPKIIAAALVSKNPVQHGFGNVQYEAPLSWESVPIRGGVDLRQLASLIDADPEYVLLLNPELRRGITPPDLENYEVRIPPEKKDILLANMSKLETKKLGHFIEHRVRSGDTLYSIARRYGTDTQSLVDLNGYSKKKTRLRIGAEVIVPVPDRHSEPRKVAKRTNETNSTKPKATPSPAGSYTVQSGDNLWDIARRHGTSVEELKRLNKLSSPRSLQVGATLKLPSSGG